MKELENDKESKMSKKVVNLSLPDGPQDGLDNTGTQGKDSLSDDAYTGSSKKPDEHSNDDHTGHSSDDAQPVKGDKLADQPGDRENGPEDDAMNYKSDRENGAYNAKNA
jgi:hypothetical protein